MNALRNEAGYKLCIYTGGRVLDLFPGRAVALADEEIKSPQIQSLIASGLARIQKIAHPAQAAKAAKSESSKHGSEKHEAPERKHEKKKGEL